MRISDRAANTNYSLPTIGGIFGKKDHEHFLLPAAESQFDAFFPTTIRGKTRLIYETGIDALAAILVELLPSRGPIRLWTVENFCRESLERLKIKLQGQVELSRYRNLEDLEKISREDVVIYLHFNRFDQTARQFIQIIKQHAGVTVIEDFAQAPLDIARFAGDFAFTSLRKFSSLDVAIAYQHEHRSVNSEESRYRMLRKEAEAVRSQFLLDPSDELEQRFLKLASESEAALAVSEIFRVHSIELERAKFFDFNTAQNLRRMNYARLFEGVKHHVPDCQILPGDYMYLMIETRHRDRLRADLFAQRIFPAIHWADSQCEYVRSLLSLHIDQRYTPADMDRVSSVVAESCKQLAVA